MGSVQLSSSSTLSPAPSVISSASRGGRNPERDHYEEWLDGKVNKMAPPDETK
jgi:hypothetical protein